MSSRGTEQLGLRYRAAEGAPYFAAPRTGGNALDSSTLPYRPVRCEGLTPEDDADLGPRC